MEIYVVACHYTKTGSLVGLRLFDVFEHKTMDVSIASVKEAIKNGSATIHDVQMKGNNIVIANQSEYTKIVEGKIKGDPKSVILSDSCIDNRFVVSTNGIMQSISDDTLIKAIKNKRIANAQVINDEIRPVRDDFTKVELIKKLFASGIEQEKKVVDSEVSRVRQLEEQKRKDELKNKKINTLVKDNKKEVDRAIQNSITWKPTRINGRQASSEELKKYGTDEMTAEHKLINLVKRLKKARPFLYSVMYSMNRVISDEVDRAATTIDTLYINPEYLRDTSMEVLIFVISHELYHVVLRHRARENKRNHHLWNVACDLYINKLLTEDFDIPIHENRAVPVKFNGKELGFYVMRYDNICYSPTIDTSVDTPEKIYLELIEEYRKQQDKQNYGEQSSDDDNGEDSGGQNDGSNSDDSSSGGDENDDGSGDSNDTCDDAGNEQGDSDGESNESDSSTSRGNGKSNRKGKFTYRDVEVNLDEYSDDMIDDDKTASMSEEQKKNRSKSIVNRAVTIQRQMAGFSGPNGTVLERMVEMDLAPKVNWRTLLKSYLISASETYTSYSSPDRRFLSRNMVLPGPKVDESGALENVKICIDTSGSITDKDLGIALGQIKQLLRTYKAKAEVMYWDTDIRSTHEFENIEQLLKIKPAGGGGTDANCIFEYFEQREYKIGKKPMPSVIVIFTDGYFPDIKDKYRKYKNVIWIVHGNAGFTCPVGKVAQFNYDD